MRTQRLWYSNMWITLKNFTLAHQLGLKNLCLKCKYKTEAKHSTLSSWLTQLKKSLFLKKICNANEIYYSRCEVYRWYKYCQVDVYQPPSPLPRYSPLLKPTWLLFSTVNWQSLFVKRKQLYWNRLNMARGFLDRGNI